MDVHKSTAAGDLSCCHNNTRRLLSQTRTMYCNNTHSEYPTRLPKTATFSQENIWRHNNTRMQSYIPSMCTNTHEYPINNIENTLKKQHHS